MNRSVKTACFILVIAVALSAQAPASLQGFFQDLLQNYQSSGLPKPETFQKVDELIAGMSSREVANALPTVDLALKHPDEKVRGEAAAAFWAVSLRPDGAELVRPYIGDIGSLFSTSSDQLHYLAAMTLVRLGQAPPEALLPMLSFIKGTDTAPTGQICAFATLLRLAPDNPQVIDAVVAFMARPLDSSTRIAALDSIHTSRAADLRVRDAVIATLDDPHAGVKLAAIGALDRMGPHALVQAESILQELEQSPNEPAEVKAAAHKALKHIDQ